MEIKCLWILLLAYILLECKPQTNSNTKTINKPEQYPTMDIDTNYFITSKHLIDSLGLYAFYDSSENIITHTIENIDKYFQGKDVTISRFMKISYELGLVTYKNDKNSWNTYLVTLSSDYIKDTLFVSGYKQIDENTILRKTFNIPNEKIEYTYNPERINPFVEKKYIINVFSEYITDDITYLDQDQYVVSMTPYFSNIDIAKNKELLATHNLEDLKHYSLNGINKFLTVEDPLEFEPDWEKYVRVLKNHDNFNLVIKRHTGGTNGRYFLYVLKNDTIDVKNSLLLATKREPYNDDEENYRYFSVIYNDFTIKRFYATGEEGDIWDTEEFFKIDNDGNLYKAEPSYDSTNQSYIYLKSNEPIYENFHSTYKNLKPLNLFDNEINPTNTTRLMEPYYPIFHNIYFDSVDDALITRLPGVENSNITPLILGLSYYSGEYSNFLFTLDENFNVIDRLELDSFYNEENGDFFSTHYSISEGYIFTLVTNRNGEKTHENHYKINNDGKVIEIEIVELGE